MKERSDFELEPPTSLRDIIVDELHDSIDNDLRRGKPVQPIANEGIEDLLQKVYARIERQALEVYKSNEPWALKAWSYSTILKDTVASEATQTMVEELVSPVMEWQDQSFDPIAYYLKRLTRKSRRTKEAYMQTAARFVAREGRKKYYPDEDIEDFQTYAQTRYPNQNS